MGVSLRTVQRFLRAETYPKRSRRRQPRCTDAYLDYLRQRTEAGCHNANRLFTELKAQGYTGSSNSVRRALRSLSLPTLHSASAAQPVADVPSSRRVVRWLQGFDSLWKSEDKAQQQAFLQRLYGFAPVLQEAGELARSFRHVLKNRPEANLEAWLAKAKTSVSKELRLFAQGLCQDLDAVRNAVTSEWSNGQTEGQVNRLKMLKRQMYGRANFDLLQARVLPLPKAA